jgi:hypothetical protein
MNQSKYQAALKQLLYRQAYDRRPDRIAKRTEYNRQRWQDQKLVKADLKLKAVEALEQMGLLG